MKNYELNKFQNGKAFIYFESNINGKHTCGNRICINSKGEKTILNTDQRKDFQKIAGKLIEDSVNELKTNNNYKNMRLRKIHSS